MRRHRRSVVLAATGILSQALVPPAPPRAPKLQATATKELDLQERKAQSPVEELGDDMCLIPGEVVVRVDAAPGNARRIYTGVDINADVDTVWALLTDYEELANVVPNLVSNDVVEARAGGARIKQVGAAQACSGAVGCYLLDEQRERGTTAP